MWSRGDKTTPVGFEPRIGLAGQRNNHWAKVSYAFLHVGKQLQCACLCVAKKLKLGGGAEVLRSTGQGFSEQFWGQVHRRGHKCSHQDVKLNFAVLQQRGPSGYEADALSTDARNASKPT